MELKNLFTPNAKQFGSQLGGIARKVTQPLVAPIQDTVSQFKEKVQPAVQGIQDTVNTGFVEPIMKPIKRNEKIGKVNKFLADKGITVDDIKNLAEADGSDPEEALKFFRDNGIKVGGMDDLQAQDEAKAKEIPQGEDLGFFGGAKELATGAFRAGEQIPRIAGAGMDFVTQNVTGPLVAGGLDLVGADELAGKYRQATKTSGEAFKKIGEDITMAGMTDGGTNPLTQKQIDMRQLGGELALTAPIGGEYLAGAKGVGGLALRSGVVGAGFGGVQPIIDKGGAATMGDIATGGAIGGVTGAVAGPVLSKVVAPAVAGIVKKTGKYGEALIKGGVEGAKKSISRNISALKAPGVETVTRNIPKKVVASNLGFTPTQRAKIEKITGKDEATYLLEKGLAGKGKEELAEIFMKQSDDMYQGITNQLAGVKEKVQAPVAKEALLDIMEQLESSPKIARAYAKDIQGVKNMLARDEFTLSELNNIRRAYDKVNTGMFTVQGKARSGLENAIDVKVRQDLSSQLQKEAKKFGVDVKQMNTELRAGIEMKDALLSRLSQEEKNNFIGLQDLGVSAILSGGNPVTALATIGVKKYAEKIAPGLAQKAYNLNKAPNVTRTVSRGNTITSSNKSSRLGLASSPSDTVVSNGITPKVEPKGVPKKVTPTKNEGIKPIKSTEGEYVKGLKKSGMNNNEVKKQLLFDKEFGGMDIPRNEFINSYISKKIGKEFKYSSDLVGRYDDVIEKAHKEAIELYKNKTTKSQGIPKKKVTTITNAKQQGITPKSSDTIPEGYFRNAFGEIVKNPSNKKGGFIRNPFAKIEPKRLFAGENSAQPPSKKTGWFKGVDGKMRYEIDDSSAKVNFNRKEIYTNDPITTILDHPELYKQYPELKNVKVTVYTPMSKQADSISANYNSEKNLIMVNGENIKSNEGLKSSILHEIQHAIQNKEGFAKGGNITNFDTGKLVSNPELNKLFEEYRGLKLKLDKLDAGENIVIHKGQPYEYKLKKDAVKRQMNILDSKINEIEDNIKYKEGKQALKNYKSLAGEVEARNVQSRMGLSAKERTIKSPQSTEDVLRAKQIIRMDSKGSSMSIIQKGIPKKTTEIGNKELSPLVEEARIPKPDEKFLVKYAEGKTLDEFMGAVRGSATQYGKYEPKLRRYLRPESKRLSELVPKDPNTRMVTIYRGIDKSDNPRIQSTIKGGDFVTTSYDDALSYTDSPANIVSKRVPISTLVTEFPEEFLKYNKGKSINEIESYELIWKPSGDQFYTVSNEKLIEIYNQSHKGIPKKK